jgi:Domain of Unknown Function (DUF1080).
MQKYLFMAFIASILCFTTSCGSNTGSSSGSSSDSDSSNEISLFNGNDLSNWELIVAGDSVPAEQVFSVQDGAILILGNPFGYMYTKEKYRNYELNVEWSWVDEPTNSGIFVMIAETTNPFPNGIECQLGAGNAGDFVMLGGSNMLEYQVPEGRERPRFPMLRKREASNEKPAGEWNKAKIITNEGVITVYINDLLQNEGTSPVKEGHIGLQSEGKRIQFRNITLIPQ